MPENAFFSATNSRSSGQPKTTRRHFFSTLHPLSRVIFATAAVVAFVLLRSSRFNFHCYAQREATPNQKSARKRRCDLSRLFVAKDYKGHSLVQTSFTEPPISRKWFTETGQIITVTSQIHGHLCILLLVNIVPFFVWHTHTTRTLFLSVLRFVVVFGWWWCGGVVWEPVKQNNSRYV